MSTGWYIAARFSKRHWISTEVRPALLRCGHFSTARWIDTDEGDETAEQARRDLDDIMIAQGVLCFTEEERCPTRGGRHFEAGFGLAHGKRLVCVGPRENIFYRLPIMEFFPDWPTAKEELFTSRPKALSLRDVYGPKTLGV
jgi:hypothetical protein